MRVLLLGMLWEFTPVITLPLKTRDVFSILNSSQPRANDSRYPAQRKSGLPNCNIKQLNHTAWIYLDHFVCMFLSCVCLVLWFPPTTFTSSWLDTLFFTVVDDRNLNKRKESQTYITAWAVPATLRGGGKIHFWSQRKTFYRNYSLCPWTRKSRRCLKDFTDDEFLVSHHKEDFKMASPKLDWQY